MTAEAIGTTKTKEERRAVAVLVAAIIFAVIAVFVPLALLGSGVTAVMAAVYLRKASTILTRVLLITALSLSLLLIVAVVVSLLSWQMAVFGS